MYVKSFGYVGGIPEIFNIWVIFADLKPSTLKHACLEPIKRCGIISKGILSYLLKADRYTWTILVSNEIGCLSIGIYCITNLNFKNEN